MMQKLKDAVRILAVALLVCSGTLLKAQVTTTASINGVVTDATDAVIPGAAVTATNVNTNVKTNATTDKAGEYNIRFLDIGTYTVQFSAPGFGTQVTKQFVLEIAQAANIPAKLSLAGETTKVTVEAQLAPLLNTEDAVQSTVLDARAIANIPLVGRSLTDLTQYQPGAISTTPSSVGNNISVNGSRNQGNSYSLNGMETNQNIDYGQTYQPNPDAVEQVQMISATPSAEYGNVEGGNFLTVLKSGTNQFHGNVFANLRNYLMDANSYGNKHRSGTPIPRAGYTTYQMGGTIGGPIIKNKLFGFGDYQGYRTHKSSQGTATVPTYLERGCGNLQPGQACTGGNTADFSELQEPNIMCEANGGTPTCTKAAGNKQLIQLYDPLNGFKPYTNNQGVPITNPVAKYLYAHNNLLPLPGSALGINGVVVSPTGNPLSQYNIGASSTSTAPGTGNVSTLSHSFSHSDQYDIKIDYAFSEKDRMSGSYSHFTSLGYATPTLPINFPSQTPNPTHIGVLDEIHTFSSAVVNDFRAGFQRYQSLGAATIDTSGVFGTNGNSILGIGGSGAKQPFQGYASQSSSVPSTLQGTLATARGGGEATGGTNNTGTNITENTFMYADNLTWLRGKHVYKFGVSVGRYQQNNFYPGNDGSLGGLIPTGLFSANPTISAGPNGYDFRGYSFADWTMDRISGTDIGGVAGPAGMRQYRDAYFANDTWKIKSNLTLNLGLRYEYNTQISEVNNKYAAPDIATQTIVLAGTSAANTYCPGCGTTLVRPFYGGILPRVGINWSIRPRLVMRTGYSASQFMEGTGANLRMTTNPPFQTAFESVASLPSSTGASGTPFTEEQGFSHTLAGAAASGSILLLWNPYDRPAYVNTWTLGTEYQFNNTASLSVSYVGKQGQHLASSGAGNQLYKPCTDPSFVKTGNAAGIYTGAFTAVVPGHPCWTSDPAPYQFVPGVGYSGQVKVTGSNGFENDNSLQVVMRQRLWHGLQYTFNFTWSHALTDNTGFYAGVHAQNYYDNHSEYADTIEDVRLAANWNMVYSLPLGRGRQFGAHMNRWLDEVVGGWVVAMTGIEQTGLAATSSVGSTALYTGGSGAERPNAYRQMKIVNRTQNQWFGNDPSTVACSGFSTTGGNSPDNGSCALAQPGLGIYGNSRFDNLRLPGNQLYNAAINKDFTIWREHAFNFRADAVNVFNQSELGSPNLNSFGGTFGQITGVKSPVRSLQLTVAYHF